MPTLTVERVIAAPLEQVFDWFSDASNYRAARPVLSERLVAPGLDAPYGVGAIRKMTWIFGSYTERMTAYEPANRIGWIIERGFPHVRHEGAELVFSKVPGGTRVTWSTTAQAPVPFAADAITRSLVFPGLAYSFRQVLKTAEVSMTSPRKRVPITRQGSRLPAVRNALFDVFLKIIRISHHILLTVSKGRVGNRQFGMPAVELHVTGRKSGARRSVVLWVPVIDSERVVLVASKEGDDRNPEWYKNLLVHPDVEITIDGVTEPWVARVADATEKAVLWPQIVKAYHGFAVYQTRTDRDIPVVVCERPGQQQVRRAT